MPFNKPWKSRNKGRHRNDAGEFQRERDGEASTAVLTPGKQTLITVKLLVIATDQF